LALARWTLIFSRSGPARATTSWRRIVPPRTARRSILSSDEGAAVK